jgi:hypothetical protein
VRRSARGNVTASLRLLSALSVIGARATSEEDLGPLREAGRLIVDEAAEQVTATDLATLREAQREALEMMNMQRRQPSPA